MQQPFYERIRVLFLDTYVNMISDRVRMCMISFERIGVNTKVVLVYIKERLWVYNIQKMHMHILMHNLFEF